MSSPARLDLKSPSSTLASPKTPLTPETPEFDELPVFTPIQPHLTPQVSHSAGDIKLVIVEGRVKFRLNRNYHIELEFDKTDGMNHISAETIVSTLRQNVQP